VHYTPNVLDGKWTDAITYGTDNSSVVLAQHRVFDAIGRLRILKDAANSENKTEMSYDANDNLQTIVRLGSGVGGYDNDNHVTYREFDGQNRVKCTMDTSPTAPSICAGSDGATTYTYDDQGNVSGVSVKVINSTSGATASTRLINSASYTYNGFGELVMVVSPDSGTTTFEYDLAGNLHKKTKGAQLEITDPDRQVITYGWDALNRLTSITYPPTGEVASSQNVTYHYDTAANEYEDCGAAIGRLCRVVRGNDPAASASSVTDYSYNAFGRITAEKKRPTGTGGIALLTGYGYSTSTGLLESTTYPSGRVVSAQRAYGRLTDLLSGTTSLSGTFEYQPFGGLSGYDMNLASGLGTWHYAKQFNTDGQLTQWSVAGPDYTRAYQYDAYGNINNITAQGSDLVAGYQYDYLNHLTSAIGPYGAYQYDYDTVGNRQSVVKYNWDATEDWEETYQYATGSNRLSSTDRKHYVDGDLISYKARTFEYDGRGNIKTDTRTLNGTDTKLHLNYSKSDRLGCIKIGAINAGCGE
jgi:YD repeat-containing protein